MQSGTDTPPCVRVMRAGPSPLSHTHRYLQKQRHQRQRWRCIVVNTTKGSLVCILIRYVLRTNLLIFGQVYKEDGLEVILTLLVLNHKQFHSTLLSRQINKRWCEQLALYMSKENTAPHCGRRWNYALICQALSEDLGLPNVQLTIVALLLFTYAACCWISTKKLLQWNEMSHCVPRWILASPVSFCKGGVHTSFIFIYFSSPRVFKVN